MFLSGGIGGDFWKSNSEQQHRVPMVVKIPQGASKRKMSKPVRQRIRRNSTHSPSPTETIEPDIKPALPPIVLTVPTMLSKMPMHSKYFFSNFDFLTKWW